MSAAATVDLFLRDATFTHTVVTRADGVEFVVLRIETPAVTLNLFPGSVSASFEDTQTAFALAETASYFWRETERLYEESVSQASRAENAVGSRAGAVAS